MVCFLDLFRSCTSDVAVCIKTCSPVASKESLTVVLVDRGSVTVLTDSVDFRDGNFFGHKLLWCRFFS